MVYEVWRESVIKHFPGPEFTYMLWTDETARQLIAHEYPTYLTMYDSLPNSLARADAARTFILHRHGGLYLDLDYEVRNSFWYRLPVDAPAVVGSYFPDERTQNSLMSSPIGHPFWNATWERMAEQLRSGCESAVECTGPQVTDFVADLFPGHVVVLPCEIFMPVATGDGSGKYHTLMPWERAIWYKLGWYRKCGKEPDEGESTCVQAVHHSVASTAGIIS